MRITVLALAACQSLALRPELVRVSVSESIAHLGAIISKISGASDSLDALKEASGLLSGILTETGNATDHVSGDDADVLRSVISLVEKTIYSSMDDAHESDVASLNDAIQTVSSCNADIADRQSPEGDLGHLHQSVQSKQTELNRLQGIVDLKTELNETTYEKFDSHNQMIAPPPACPGLPSRTMPSLDIFFDESEYVIWYTAQQTSYTVLRDLFVAADAALQAAINAYDIWRAVRDTQYCDWKGELEAACAAFDVCFSEASDFYTSELVPRVTLCMNDRIETKKAGDTLVHQIKFLLGQAEDQTTPEIETSRFEIEFPDLPAKGLCDLSPLDADIWVPSVVCSVGLFADGSLIQLDITPGTVEETDLVTDAQRCARNRGNGLVNCLSDSNIAAGAWNVVTLRVEDPTGAGDGKNVRLHHVDYGYCNIGVVGPRFGCNADQADAASWTFEKSNKSPGSFNLFTNGYSAILSHDNYLIFQGHGQRPNRFVDFDIVQVTA